jgi:hypothetical protein
MRRAGLVLARGSIFNSSEQCLVICLWAVIPFGYSRAIGVDRCFCACWYWYESYSTGGRSCVLVLAGLFAMHAVVGCVPGVLAGVLVCWFVCTLTGGLPPKDLFEKVYQLLTQ